MIDTVTAQAAQQFRTSSNAQKAAILAAAGVPVFPCHAGPKKTKAPLTQRGFRDRTSDANAVARWWKRWPDALIGLVPGDIDAVVIDLDVKDGRDGVSAFRQMEANWRDWPATRTLSGGEHVWAAKPSNAAIGNATGGLSAGIDIRCDRGYVCLGRAEDGREYEDLGGVFETLIDPEGRFPALPATVRDALQQAKPANTSTYCDYTAQGYPQEYVPTTLSELHVHAPSLDDWRWEGDDRSRDAYTWLCKAVAGLCQAREIDAKDIGDAEVKNLCELAIEADLDFMDHYVDRGYGKLGYDADSAADWAADAGLIHIPQARHTRKAEADAAEVEPLDIYIRQGTLAQTIERCEAYLVALGVPVFSRGPLLVRPAVNVIVDSMGRRVPDPVLLQVTAPFMRQLLARHITFWRPQGTPKGVVYVEADPPKDLVDGMLSRAGEWPYLPIGGIITTPTLRPDGSILSVAGYDDATSLYLIQPLELPAMSETPTRADAEAAGDLLDALLVDFPFDGEGSDSTAMSMLITPVVRGCLDVAPMHLTAAPEAGSGKSYLADVSSAIVAGTRCAVMSAGKTEEETGKRIGAHLLAGTSIICLDNLDNDLGGDDMCQIIERPLIDIRILGKSEKVKVVNRACVFATGNNPKVRGDMVRRTLVVGLDAKCERPEEREFPALKPFARILADRGKYVAACLTIVRAYMAAGSPPQKLKPLASFEVWSDRVRSALVWLGYADPCITMQRARRDDPERQQLGQFMSAFEAEIGIGAQHAISTADMAELHVGGSTNRPCPKMREALAPFVRGALINNLLLGRWLGKHKGRVVNDIILMNKILDGSPIWYLHRP